MSLTWLRYAHPLLGLLYLAQPSAILHQVIRGGRVGPRNRLPPTVAGLWLPGADRVYQEHGRGESSRTGALAISRSMPLQSPGRCPTFLRGRRSASGAGGDGVPCWLARTHGASITPPVCIDHTHTRKEIITSKARSPQCPHEQGIPQRHWPIRVCGGRICPSTINHAKTPSPCRQFQSTASHSSE
jgi:hypothetical protein